MPVQTISVTTQVPKETKEIIDAVTNLVSYFKKGGDVAGAMGLLPEVMRAVDGWDKVGEEVKSQHKAHAAGYLVDRVWSALDSNAAVQV